MKKLCGIFFALAAFSALAETSFDAVKADALRMELEKSPDAVKAEASLIDIVRAAPSGTLRDGAIYSLGKMKSAKAFALVCEIARLKKNRAAMLALAEYSDAQSEEILRELAPNNTAAAAALEMRRARDGGREPLGKFEILDENGKVRFLQNLSANGAGEEFLLVLKSDSRRISRAQAFALSRAGDGLAAAKIFELSESDSDESYALALACAKGAQDEILKRIHGGSQTALRAAAIARMSEAEAPTAELLHKIQDAKLRAACLDVLRVCLSSEKFSDILNLAKSADDSELPAFVKACVFAVSRSDPKKSSAMKTEAAELAKSSQGRQRAAFERIARGG